MDEALEGWKESQGLYLNLSGCTTTTRFAKFFQDNQKICSTITARDMDGCIFNSNEELSIITKSL